MRHSVSTPFKSGQSIMCKEILKDTDEDVLHLVLLGYWAFCIVQYPKKIKDWFWSWVSAALV